MVTVGTAEPLAVAVVGGIRSGDLPALQRLLTEHPLLATAELGDDDPGGMRASRKRVALLMRTHGLVGCHRRPAAVAHRRSLTSSAELTAVGRTAVSCASTGKLHE